MSYSVLAALVFCFIGNAHPSKTIKGIRPYKRNKWIIPTQKCKYLCITHNNTYIMSCQKTIWRYCDYLIDILDSWFSKRQIASTTITAEPYKTTLKHSHIIDMLHIKHHKGLPNAKYARCSQADASTAMCCPECSRR